MAKRVFGAPVSDSQKIEPKKVDTLVVENESAPPKTSDVQPKTQSVKKPSKRIIAIAAAAAIVIIGTASFVFYNKIYDSHYGDSNPSDAAKGYVAAMLNKSNDVNEYLPSDIRKASMLSADTAWINKHPYSDIENINVDITSADEEDGKNLVGTLEAGLANTYSKDVTVDDAKIVHMTAHVTGDNYDGNLKFDVIVIKQGFKWYAYTGDAEALSDICFVPDYVLLEDNPETSTEVSTEAPVPATEPYSEADDDVMAGNFKLNTFDISLPVRYDSIRDILRLKDEVIDESDRLIEKETALENLPVVLADVTYDSSCVTIDVANINTEPIDVKYGYVVGLTVHKSANGVTPNVVLPGNAVIGTSLTEIRILYGSSLKSSSFIDDFAKLGDVSEVYKMSLGLDGNDLYFGFDSNDKLVAVKWIYTDLNDHISYD